MDTKRRPKAGTEEISCVDSALLKYYISTKGDTLSSLAAAMNVSPTWLSAKVNNAPGAEFWQSEIMFIRNKYKLSPEEVCRIFFDQKVS